MWVHRLTDIDPIKRTALCANCGVVRVTRKKDGFRCGYSAYVYNLNRKYGHEIKSKPSECEVCGSNNRIVYDHCHKTGEFRGWICNACNVALGLVSDDPGILRALARYIEKATIQ